MTEVLDAGDTPEQLLEKLLAGLDLDIVDEVETKYYCGCSKERVERAIVSIGRKEIEEMIADGKEIEVGCQFCDRKYVFSVDELKGMVEPGTVPE